MNCLVMGAASWALPAALVLFVMGFPTSGAIVACLGAVAVAGCVGSP